MMKRSEMLSIIRDTLLDMDDVVLYGNYWPERFLAAIEAAGMMPPIVVVHPNSYNRNEGTYGFEVNEWEPEDA